MVVNFHAAKIMNTRGDFTKFHGAAEPQPRRLKPLMDTNGHELLNRRGQEMTTENTKVAKIFSHRLRAGVADTDFKQKDLAVGHTKGTKENGRIMTRQN